MNDILLTNNALFESIKKTDGNGIEYWSARELQKILEYAEWRNFIKVIEKAKIACENSEYDVNSHFIDVNMLIEADGVAPREMQDIMLTRYACYLITQNGDPRKKIIALAQTYFAIKTREKEMEEQISSASEDLKRIAIRDELIHHNKSLAEAAQDAGVSRFASFQNHGYRGLYNGLDARDIHRRKNLKDNEKILDFMGSTELAANLFRATQTDEKLRRSNIHDEKEACRVHYSVGKIVRKTIEELGGTMPEDLPTPKESIKALKKKEKKKLKSSQKGNDK